MYIVDYFPPWRTLCNVTLQILYMKNYESIQFKKNESYMLFDDIKNVKSLSILGSERTIRIVSDQKEWLTHDADQESRNLARNGM